MARGLAQPEQRLQDVDLRSGEAVAVDGREQRAPIMVPQLVIDGTLWGLELTVERLLGAAGKLGGYLRLRAPEDERPERAGEQLARLGIGVAEASLECAENGGAP